MGEARRILNAFQVIFLLAVVLLNLSSAADAASMKPRVYVTIGNQENLANSVVVIDPSASQIVEDEAIVAGHSPNAIVISRDGLRVWTTHGFSHVIGDDVDKVTAWDLTNRKAPKLLGTITKDDGLVKRIGDPALSPPDPADDDEKLLLVPSNSQDPNRGNQVSIINIETFEVTNVAVGNLPLRVATGNTRKGPRAYVTNHISENVSVIDLQTLEVVATILVPGRPAGVAVGLEGKRVYVTLYSENKLSIIDTTSDICVTTPTPDECVTTIDVPDGMGLIDVAVHPSNKAVYVVGESSGNVSVVELGGDPKAGKVVSVSDLGSEDPRKIAFKADGTRAYVSNRVSRAIVALDTHDPLNPSLPLPDEKIDVIVKDEMGNDVRVNTLGIAVFPKPELLQNEPPVAKAGDDQAIRAGETVFLDGSSSFDDNTSSELLGYAWSFSSKPQGSAAVLSGTNTQSASFVADVAGTYVVQLVVTDEGGLSSAPDEVVISSDNLAPIANAGEDRLVITNNVVTLDGSGSTDPEGDPRSFSWTLVSKPNGSSAALTHADTPNPSFTPDLEGTYVVELVVSDPIGPSAPDSVEITATNAESFAEIKIEEASGAISALPPDDVTTKGNQNALTNFLSQTALAIQEGDLAEARNKLQKAIGRTDGCVLRGTPDGNGPGLDHGLRGAGGGIQPAQRGPCRPFTLSAKDTEGHGNNGKVKNRGGPGLGLI